MKKYQKLIVFLLPFIAALFAAHLVTQSHIEVGMRGELERWEHMRRLLLIAGFFILLGNSLVLLFTRKSNVTIIGAILSMIALVFLCMVAFPIIETAYPLPTGKYYVIGAGHPVVMLAIFKSLCVIFCYSILYRPISILFSKLM